MASKATRPSVAAKGGAVVKKAAPKGGAAKSATSTARTTSGGAISKSTRGGAGTRGAAGGRRSNEGGNRASIQGRTGAPMEGRSNDAESTRTENVGTIGQQYHGSDIATGTQTPEGITTPSDLFDSGAPGMGHFGAGDKESEDFGGGATDTKNDNA